MCETLPNWDTDKNEKLFKETLEIYEAVNKSEYVKNLRGWWFDEFLWYKIWKKITIINFEHKKRKWELSVILDNWLSYLFNSEHLFVIVDQQLRLLV